MSKSPAPPGFFLCPMLHPVRLRETIFFGVRIFVWCGFAAGKISFASKPRAPVAISMPALFLEKQSR
jgi:hypothetical protein